MPAHIPIKHLILMLLGGLACAVGIVFLLNYIFQGPKLGLHYDFLLKYLKTPAPSREIVIIDTDEFAEGSDIFTVFMTLTEMNASNLVMTGKVSPSSSPIMLTEADIKRRFAEEYSIVGDNIRGLFEGIRMGTVTPQYAPLYVQRVVELTELGRDRLLSALVDRDEDLIRSATVFGNYLEVQSDPLFERDGKIRRVKLLDVSFEPEKNPNDFSQGFVHPVYLNLRNRYLTVQTEYTEHGWILWLLKQDRTEFDITLDKEGNVITPWNCQFRRIDISLFRDYEEAGFILRDALQAADEFGAFSEILPELSPFYLGDHTYVLKEDLLKTPVSESRIAWRNARQNYISSLNDYFLNPSLLNQIKEYEELIADTDPLNEEIINNLIKNRDEIISYFSPMHEAYTKFSALHSKLEEELMFSYCIMGPKDNALYSALIANVMMTGNHIKLPFNRHIIFWFIICSFAVLLAVFLLRPILLFIIGFSLSLFCSIAFSIIFIYFSIWFDPVIILSSSLTGVLLIFYCKCAVLRHRERTFRSAYGAVVSKNILKNLIAYGRPRLSEVNIIFAVIIAIKDTALLSTEANEKPQDAGNARNSFIASVKKVIFNAGAVIVGFEGDTILASFGSPLEFNPSKKTYKWSSLARSYNPIDKACALVRGILEIENNTWRFGIDAGDCTFYWMPETGYSVNGLTAVRARILVSKTTRLKVRALITDIVRKKLDLEDEASQQTALGFFSDKTDTFYELT
ncbi:MAG: hypothetical protein FWC12_05805 [Treponema sp.]|nr:hypothetical protein [Treponema sp.]